MSALVISRGLAMTARLEIYMDDDHDDVIADVLSEHVPRIGECINLQMKRDDLREFRVADLVYMLDHGRHERVMQVCVYVRNK